MKTHKQINVELRDSIEAGYIREDELKDELMKSNNEIFCLVAANAKLKQQIYRSKLH